MPTATIALRKIRFVRIVASPQANSHSSMNRRFPSRDDRAAKQVIPMREVKSGMLDLGQPSADMLVSIQTRLFPDANRDSANAGQSGHRRDDCAELAGAVRGSTRSPRPPWP